MQSQTASPERDDAHGSPWNPTHIGDSSAAHNDGHSAPSTPSESSGSITRLASIDSFDSRWWAHSELSCQHLGLKLLKLDSLVRKPA